MIHTFFMRKSRRSPTLFSKYKKQNVEKKSKEKKPILYENNK